MGSATAFALGIFGVVLIAAAIIVFCCGCSSHDSSKSSSKKKHKHKNHCPPVCDVGVQGPPGVGTQGPVGPPGPPAPGTSPGECCGITNIVNEGSPPGAGIFDFIDPATGTAYLRTLVPGCGVTALQGVPSNSYITLTTDETAPGIEPPVDLVVYIASAADGGSDISGTGEFATPFESIQRALREVRCQGWDNSATIQIKSVNYPLTLQDSSERVMDINVGSRGIQRLPLMIRGLPLSTNPPVASGTVLAAAFNDASGLWLLTVNAPVVPGQLLHFTSGPWSAVAINLAPPTQVTVYAGIVTPSTSPPGLFVVEVALGIIGGLPDPTGSGFDVQATVTTVTFPDAQPLMSWRSDGVIYGFEDINFVCAPTTGFSGWRLVNSQVGFFGCSFSMPVIGNTFFLAPLYGTILAGRSSDTTIQESLFNSIAFSFKGIAVLGGPFSSFITSSNEEASDQQWVIGNSIYLSPSFLDITGSFKDVIFNSPNFIQLQLNHATRGLFQHAHMASFAFIQIQDHSNWTLAGALIESSGAINVNEHSTVILQEGSMDPSPLAIRMTLTPLITPPFTLTAISLFTMSQLEVSTNLFIDGYQGGIQIDGISQAVLHRTVNFSRIVNNVIAVTMASTLNSTAPQILNDTLSFDGGGNPNGIGLLITQGSFATLSDITANNNNSEGIRISEGAMVCFRDSVTARFNGQNNMTVQAGIVDLQCPGEEKFNLSGEASPPSLFPTQNALSISQSRLVLGNSAMLQVQNNQLATGIIIGDSVVSFSSGNPVQAYNCVNGINVQQGSTVTIGADINANNTSSLGMHIQSGSRVTLNGTNLNFLNNADGNLRIEQSELYTGNGGATMDCSGAINGQGILCVASLVYCSAAQVITSNNNLGKNGVGLRLVRSQWWNTGNITADGNSSDGVQIREAAVLMVGQDLSATGNTDSPLAVANGSQCIIGINRNFTAQNNGAPVLLTNTDLVAGSMSVNTTTMGGSAIITRSRVRIAVQLNLQTPAVDAPANLIVTEMSTLEVGGNAILDVGVGREAVVGQIINGASTVVYWNPVNSPSDLPSGPSPEKRHVDLLENSSLTFNSTADFQLAQESSLINALTAGITVQDQSQLYANTLNVRLAANIAVLVFQGSAARIMAGELSTIGPMSSPPNSTGVGLLVSTNSQANIGTVATTVFGVNGLYGLDIRSSSKVTFAQGRCDGLIGMVGDVKVGANPPKTWAVIDAQGNSDSNDYPGNGVIGTESPPTKTELCSAIIEVLTP